jgi:DNA uptake protein ComE-like DNA-binding protein
MPSPRDHRSRTLAGLTVAAALAATLVGCGGGAEQQAADTSAPTPAVAAPGDSAAGVSPADTTPAAGDSATQGALLDPDGATREQLAALPGMTPGAADALVAGRPYADMRAVDRTLAAQIPDSSARRTLYARLWKPIDINKASEAEMLLIPGVGKRMAHEFEEYRPYRDVARFRREIGKYADSTEVARLERYVSIR